MRPRSAVSADLATGVSCVGIWRKPEVPITGGQPRLMALPVLPRTAINVEKGSNWSG